MLFTRVHKFTALSVPKLSLNICWIRDDCQQSDREVWMLRKENTLAIQKKKDRGMKKKIQWEKSIYEELWKRKIFGNQTSIFTHQRAKY